MPYPYIYADHLPKIIYDTTSGEYGTLYFSWQIRLPREEYSDDEAITNTAPSGAQETLYYREDEYFTFKMEWQTEADKINWYNFIQHALKGKEFMFYEDKSEDTYVTYTLDMRKWVPRRMFPIYNRYEWTCRFRRKTHQD